MLPDVDPALSVVRQLFEGDGFVDGHAQTENVRLAQIDAWVVVEDFSGQVARVAFFQFGLPFEVVQPSQPQVGDLQHRILEKDVFGFDVEMDHFVFVHALQSLEGLLEEVLDRGFEELDPFSSLAVDGAGKAVVAVLHDQIEFGALHPGVIVADDVLGFLAEDRQRSQGLHFVHRHSRCPSFFDGEQVASHPRPIEIDCGEIPFAQFPLEHVILIQSRNAKLANELVGGTRAFFERVQKLVLFGLWVLAISFDGGDERGRVFGGSVETVAGLVFLGRRGRVGRFRVFLGGSGFDLNVHSSLFLNYECEANILIQIRSAYWEGLRPPTRYIFQQIITPFIKRIAQRFFIIITILAMEKLEWKAIQPSNKKAPHSRWGHACCCIRDQIVVFGGYAEAIYMNDVWVFNVQRMEWEEIQTTGDLPSCRSNCSFTYDRANNQLILFGGGGSNRNRFNSIYSLDWQTKVWREIVPSSTAASSARDQPIPWERTYHSGELIYPYLVVFGGESIADMDDLWVFNLETSQWKEVPIPKEATRPCGRRFHSSCVIGNQFFVIAGCHSKYRCICDIYSIDFTPLVEHSSIEGLSWKKWNNSTVLRWGHTSSVFEEKIYIFGGRFCSDLNDVVVLDPKKETIKTLKISNDSLPSARRKPTSCFVGSCMIMFGGFNNEYYNDLYCLNVAENKLQPKLVDGREADPRKFIDSSLFADTSIETADGKHMRCHRDVLLQCFASRQQLDKFLSDVQRSASYDELHQLLCCLYNGYGSHPLCDRYSIKLPAKDEKRVESLKKAINEKYESCYFSRYYQKYTHLELSDEDFADFLESNRSRTIKDTRIVVNGDFMIESSRVRLSMAAPYFRFLFSGKWREINAIEISLPIENIVLFEILVNYLLLDLLIVPSSMNHQNWIQLHRLANFFSLRKLEHVCECQIHARVSTSNVEEIVEFAQREGLEELCQLCANFKVRSMEKNMVEIFSYNITELNQFKTDKYLKRAYDLRRFEINQKLLSKDHVMRQMLKKKSGTSNSSVEKENFEVCNE